MRALVLVLALGSLALGCDGSRRGEPPDKPEPIAKPADPTPDQPSPPARRDTSMPEEAEERAACGDANACFDKGEAAQRAGAMSQAVSDFEAACGLGLAVGCSRLGELYRRGKGVQPDDRRARELFEQACMLGSSTACDAVGH